MFVVMFFFFNDTATTEIYTYLHTLSLPDALPISAHAPRLAGGDFGPIHDNNRHRRRTKGPAGDMAKSGVDYVRNATRTKKFPLGLIFGAFALMGMAPELGRAHV